MIFSLVGDKEPLSCMRGYAPKHAGIVVGLVGPGKSREELSYVVHYHKNPISFFDFHFIRHSAQNQPKVHEPDARRYLVTIHMPRVFNQFENEGIAAPGGK
jgi:hypothetical protein